MHRIVVAAAILLAFPSVHAMSLDVEGPQVPLEPDTQYPLTLFATLPCTAVLASSAMEPRINVSIDTDGLAVVGPTSTEIDRQECAGKQEVSVQLNYQVHSLNGSLAEEPLPIHFAVVLEGAEERGEASFEVEVAYAGLFRAVALSDHRQAGPQKDIPFEVEIQNLANARTTFSFYAVEPPQEGDLMVPSEVILEPPGEGASSIVVVVRYLTPFENGPNKASEDLFIEIRSASAKNGAAGENATVKLTADTKGFYVPSGVGIPAAALAAAFLARRRL